MRLAHTQYEYKLLITRVVGITYIPVKPYTSMAKEGILYVIHHTLGMYIPLMFDQYCGWLTRDLIDLSQ